MASFVGKETKEGYMIDGWCDILDKAKDEDYFDKKFWAFLNGYLNLKMAQLLASELSIVEASVKLYIKDHKEKHPDSNLHEGMSFGAFLDEMKDEPKHLVDFNVFLAHEFLEQATDDSKNKGDEGIEDIEEEEAKEVLVGSEALLRKNIEQLKLDFTVISDKRAFSIDNFIRSCT